MDVSAIVINQGYAGLNPVQFGREQCRPGHSFGPAVRTHWLLHYIVSGCGRFCRDGVDNAVAAGDMFVIRPFEETYYEADHDRPWQYIWIGFEAAALPCALDAPVLHCAGAGRIFDDMLRCASMENGRSAFLSGKLWELFSLLLEQSRTPQADYVEKAIHRMQAEYMNGIGVADMARQLNLDRSYFSALFKRSTGLPPQVYLNNLRLAHAAELMVEHGQTPSTAALSTGYADLYSFSKMFKRHFGVSPREYIRRNRRGT